MARTPKKETKPAPPPAEWSAPQAAGKLRPRPAEAFASVPAAATRVSSATASYEQRPQPVHESQPTPRIQEEVVTPPDTPTPSRPTPVEAARRLARLTDQLRKLHLDKEVALSPLVVLRAQPLVAGTVEKTSAIDEALAETPEPVTGGAQSLVKEVTPAELGKLFDMHRGESVFVHPPGPGGGSLQAGPLSVRMDVAHIARALGRGLAVRDGTQEVHALRQASPDVRLTRVAYAYPQAIRTLGAQLLADGVMAPVAADDTQWPVHVTDLHGTPIPDIPLIALLDFDKKWFTHCVTNTQGMAQLRVPAAFSAVELLLADPAHSYWSRFDANVTFPSAPPGVQLQLRPVLPDPYALLSQYIPPDPQAGEGVKVAVIDTGVGPHQALKVVRGGCTVTGEDARDYHDYTSEGHGTHVAGIIAAKPGVGLAASVMGLAPASELYAYRAIAKNAEHDEATGLDIAAALERALDEKCDVINISLGGTQPMPEVEVLLERAWDEGALVFAATGNDSLDELRYPARYARSLAVGALGNQAAYPTDTPQSFHVSGMLTSPEFVARFSNHGPETDFIGVGVALLSTYPGDRYAVQSGTSMASPFLAGMAARLLGNDTVLRDGPRNAARAHTLVVKLTQACRPFVHWPPEYWGAGLPQ